MHLGKENIRKSNPKSNMPPLIYTLTSGGLLSCRY